MGKLLNIVRRILPKSLLDAIRPVYHTLLAQLAAVIYRHPSQGLFVIGVTGTNGKSTTIEFLSAILEEAGYVVASSSSIRFRIKGVEHKNELKMTMPGRFQMQKFLRNALKKGCTHVILEVTSEGIKQFRHTGIQFQMAVLTNVTPEHIESHGSFEAYRAAKAELFKIAPIHILNADDTENFIYFSKISSKTLASYSIKDFPEHIAIQLPGDFNKANAMAAIAAARVLGVKDEPIKRGIERVRIVPGRLEVIRHEPFKVVVDYAHTPDALNKVYETLLSENPKSEIRNPKLICVLGSAGGGRDKWKRPEMGKIAAEHCGQIILTNEDPYDEDPAQIISDIKSGIFNFQFSIFKEILDRREAIHFALEKAQPGDTVIITGKGCESVIMGPNGERIPWDDREVVKEELGKLKHESRSSAA